MATKFSIKRNDTGPLLVLDLTDAAGAAIDLSGAVSATFHMTTRAGVEKVNAAAVISEDAETPNRVTYTWVEGDTDTAGTFLGEVEIDFGGGLVETFPNTTDLQIVILRDLA